MVARWRDGTCFCADARCYAVNVSVLLPLYRLSRLSILALAYNGLTGSLPEQWCAWARITVFDVRGNRLQGKYHIVLVAVDRISHDSVWTGELPSAYSSWVTIQRFYVWDNLLTGR